MADWDEPGDEPRYEPDAAEWEGHDVGILPPWEDWNSAAPASVSSVTSIEPLQTVERLGSTFVCFRDTNDATDYSPFHVFR